MSDTKTEPRPFNLCGSHAVLDFVNSLDNRFLEDGPLELLPQYADLLRFTEQSRLLKPEQLRHLANSVKPATAARALRSARELREALAAAFYAGVEGRMPPPQRVRTLERYFHEASAHRKLRWREPSGDSDGHFGFAWDWNCVPGELPVWVLANSAAALLLSESMSRVRACGSESCRWLFLDASKNHTRRWCDMRICGNRMKARRFQERRAD